MQVLDYHRSFFMFEMDFEAFPPKTVTDRRQNLHNRARIRIDCRCTVTGEDGSRCDFYLGESCKTERVGADRALGIFTQPNADVRLVMSEEETLILKSWERNDMGVMLTPPSLGPQPERHVIATREAFHGHRFMLAGAEGAVLDTPSAVVEAVDAGSPLVARTAFTSGGYRVELEHPLFTINVSERYGFFQTDTGPVLYPDLEKPFSGLADSLYLAYSAFNGPDWVEFIVQRRTPVAEGVTVSHYSESVTTASTNTIIATP